MLQRKTNIIQFVTHIREDYILDIGRMLNCSTFSHLADAFIQSDLHMCDLQCIHILHLHLVTLSTVPTCTSGAGGGSVSCSRTLRLYLTQPVTHLTERKTTGQEQDEQREREREADCKYVNR